MRCILLILLLFSKLIYAQSMDEKIKALANEMADQAVKNGAKKVAVLPLGYKNGCLTEFGYLLAEDLTGNLAIAGRPITVVNQERLKDLLKQNKLNVTAITKDPAGASRLGQVSSIDALIYGTITTLGEEIRLSVSVIRLPTLEVFGYARSQIPLTGGIKAMLACQEAEEPKDDPTASNSPRLTAIKCNGRNSAGALFTVKECTLNNRQVECSLLVTNERADKADAIFDYGVANSYIITDSGRQYRLSHISIGNTSSEWWGVRYTAHHGINVTGQLRFTVEDSSVKSLQIFEMKDQGLRCLNVPVGGSR